MRGYRVHMERIVYRTGCVDKRGVSKHECVSIQQREGSHLALLPKRDASIPGS